jgi:hypothetical protein
MSVCDRYFIAWWQTRTKEAKALGQLGQNGSFDDHNRTIDFVFDRRIMT